MELSEKSKVYLENLIFWDLLHWKNFWELTREWVDKLKKYTLKVGIKDEIWAENYIYNMEKILKYQIETWWNYEIVLKTCFHILIALSRDVDERYWIDLCIISFLQFWYLYWFDVLENDPDFFNPIKKNHKVNKDFSSFWYNIETFAPSDEYWEKDYITLYTQMFSKIWYSYLNDLFKISTKKPKYSQFSICWLLFKNKYELTLDQKRILFNPWNLEYDYHPAITTSSSLDDLNKKINYFQKEYSKVSEYSKPFCNFMFDCARYKWQIKKTKSKNKILSIFSEFDKKYRYFSSKKWNIINVTENESEMMKNQYFFMDLLRSRYNVEHILEESSIEDLRELFYYFYDKIPSTPRFNYAKWINDDDNFFYRRYIIFELSRIFLHRQIKKEQFDKIHSLYSLSLKDPKIAIIYNLTLWKFSFSFIHIWTEYFLQWYNLLLKQLFKNFWLKNVWDWLDEFKEIWKESSNAMSWYYEENDDDISRLIFSDEWIWHEFKASLRLDWRKKLQTSKSEKMPLLSIIKPIVAFLNWNVPWKIVVWIREWEKVKEEIEKEKYFSYEDLEKYWIKSSKRSNSHYLTWIDLEVQDLLWNKTDDNLKQRIDTQISQYITPAPQIWWGTISLDIKKFLWRKVLIVDIKPWNTIFCLKQQVKTWSSKKIENIVYVRKNWADEKVTDPVDIIKLTESKKLDITVVTEEDKTNEK